MDYKEVIVFQAKRICELENKLKKEQEMARFYKTVYEEMYAKLNAFPKPTA